jgi:hypothetical protein
VPTGAPMPGGNTAPVIRVGNTVHRQAGPWTAQVQALMRGLRAAGVAGVPEPLGINGSGTEIVEYVDGDVGVYPMPRWVWSDDLLVEVAARVRQFHDASVDLDLPLDGWRRKAVHPVEVICHSDLAPYNTVCRDGHLVALIDWDYAVPGPRGWDLGYAAYRWVPLTVADVGLSRTDLERRLAIFCQEYGAEPAEVVRWAIVRLDDLIAYSLEQAAAGVESFVRTNAEGHLDVYRADLAWLRAEW